MRRTLTGLVHGRIVAVDRSATDAVLLTIEPNRNWTSFQAGQYTQVSVEIDGVRHTRCYSLCSVAGSSDRFQLGVKAHPQGLVSRWLVANAEVGMVVGLTPATGEFVLPDNRPARTLLISGGSGITPVLSMLRTLCAEGHTAPVTFLHYNGSPQAVLCREEIEALAVAHPNVSFVMHYGALIDE
jgi:ferredoxin-NADP reductase